MARTGNLELLFKGIWRAKERESKRHHFTMPMGSEKDQAGATGDRRIAESCQKEQDGPFG